MSSGFPPAIMKVLIVDDDQVDRELVRRTLQKAPRFNARLSEATNFEEGLKATHEDSYDVILLDYIMPGRDGFELLKELRHSDKARGTAIVVMSNSEDEDLALRCIRAGAQDFLLKSEINVSKLSRVVMQARARFELEQAVEDAETRADTDTLTGLYNRTRFDKSLRRAIDGSRKEDTSLALLFFDLDSFKSVNDTYGHQVGDGLLRGVTERISDTLRGGEFFARLGGDEFAILLPGLQDSHHAAVVAKRLIALFEKPFAVGDHQISTSISIGIAIAPQNSRDPDELMQFADIAMYKAKASGTGQIAFFEDAMQQEFFGRHNAERKLADAIHNHEIYVMYQPIYSADEEKITGAEALARCSSDNEALLPGNFIPMAESADLIFQIGEAVIEQAVGTLARWLKIDSDLFLSLNLSSQQILDANLLELLVQTTTAHGVPPTSLELEISETTLQIQPHIVERRLRDLAACGFGITLENFGRGLSSVAPMLRLPISKVKIDGSMIHKLEYEEGEKTLAFLRGFKALADQLNIRLAVAGIESDEQLHFCKQLGIRHAQGFRLAHPDNDSDFARRLATTTADGRINRSPRGNDQSS